MDDGKKLVQQVINSLQRKRVLLFNRADVDVDDYLQAGYIGYINALKGYDAGKGPFGPYAWLRIRGAVIDYTRSLTGRFVRQAPLYIEDIGPEGMHWEPQDMKTPTAEQQLISNENKEEIAAMMQHLREGHRHVLTRYYFDHRTMKEIGNEVGLTESRISQIHDAAIQALQVFVKQPRRWKMEVESAKRKLFDELCNVDVDVDGEVSVASLVITTGIKSTTILTYLNEFVNAAPLHILKKYIDGTAYYYYNAHDKTRDQVYDMIKALNRKPGKKLERKHPKPLAAAEMVKPLSTFMPITDEDKRKVHEEKKDILGDIVKKKMREVTASPSVELVVKLRIQIQVEQI